MGAPAVMDNDVKLVSPDVFHMVIIMCSCPYGCYGKSGLLLVVRPQHINVEGQGTVETTFVI